MSEFEKLFDVVKSTAVNKYKKMWGDKLAEMHDVALEQMKPIFKAVYVEGAKSKQAEINDLKQQLAEAHTSRVSWVEYSQRIESGEFVLVPKLLARKGGYYIRDTRLPIGNCMKFWYTHGYGTKHSKFHWFETLEQAQHHVGGAGWFEIWYAPYIDSIIESTADIQKAYRSEERAMIEALENNNE